MIRLLALGTLLFLARSFQSDRSGLRRLLRTKNVFRSLKYDEWVDTTTNAESQDPKKQAVASQIVAFGRSGNWQEAKRIFDDLKSRKTPNVGIYSAIVTAASACDLTNELDELLDELVSVHGDAAVIPQIYDEIMGAFCRANQHDYVVLLLNRMLQRQLEDKRSSSSSTKQLKYLSFFVDKCISTGLQSWMKLIYNNHGPSGAKRQEFLATVQQLRDLDCQLFGRSKSMLIKLLANVEAYEELHMLQDTFFSYDSPKYQPDIRSLEVYVTAMHVTYPAAALKALRAFLHDDDDNISKNQPRIPITDSRSTSASSSEQRPVIFSGDNLVQDASPKNTKQTATATTNTATASQVHPTVRTLGYAMKAVAKLYEQTHASTGSYRETTAATDTTSSTDPESECVRTGSVTDASYVVRLLEASVVSGTMNIGLILTALAACRSMNDWQIAFEVYNMAKAAAKEGRLWSADPSYLEKRIPGDQNQKKQLQLPQENQQRGQQQQKREQRQKKETKTDTRSANPAAEATTTTATATSTAPAPAPSITAPTLLTVLPSIIYGQAVSVVAKGGAESQTFQIFCEMLEAGIVPLPVTVDYVLLELSKAGSHIVAIGLLDRLKRYRVSVSNMALNAVLNACDKAGAHDRALELFASNRITAEQLDELGLSVLLKACDRLMAADWAVTVLQAVVKAGIMKVGSAYYERVFATLVKSENSAQLAVDLLLHIELTNPFGRSDRYRATAAPLAAAAAAGSLPKGSTNANNEGRGNLADTNMEQQKKGSTGGRVAVAETKIDSLRPQQTRRYEHAAYGVVVDGVGKSSHAPGSANSHAHSHPQPTHGKHSSKPSQQQVASNSPEYKRLTEGVLKGDQEPLSDTFRQLIGLQSHPVADPCIYAAVISSLASSRRAPEAWALLQSYVSRGGRELEEMYTSAIFACRYSLDVATAEKVFSQLKRRAQKTIVGAAEANLADFDETTSESRLGKRSQRSANAEVRQHVNGNYRSRPVPVMKSPMELTVVSYNALLAVYSACGVLPEKGPGVLEEMAAQGFTMDSYTYTALMTGEQDHRKIMDGWNQMRTSGITPTKAAAHEFFRACVAAKDGDAALDALNWMWSLDAPSSLPSSSLSSDATALTRNTTGESNVLSSPTPSSSSTGVTVDVSMCSKVLAALGTQGKTAECMELLSMMRDRGLAPTALCYQIVLSALEKAGDWQKAVNLLLQMQTRGGVRIDHRAINTVMSACGKGGQWQLIIKLLSQMPTLSGNSFVPTAASYSHAINAACKLHDPTKALELMRTKVEDGFLPSATSLSQIISLLESIPGREAESADVFEEFVAQHLGKEFYPAEDVSQKSMEVDVHGFTTALARAAVRSALYNLRESTVRERSTVSANIADSSVAVTDAGANTVKGSGAAAPVLSGSSSSGNSSLRTRNLIIITGIGRNSKELLEPVLRPALREWLESSFNPPLIASELTDNPGRLIIPGACIHDWITSTEGKLK